MIRRMRLFAKRYPQDADGYYHTDLAAADVQADAMARLTVGGVPLIVTALGAEVVAFAAECPHAAANLAHGSLHRGRIVCPEHGWKFDIRSGRTVWPEDEVCRLKKYAVRIADGVVCIRVA